MPYIEHNFLPGQKLTAQMLNEMDAQIRANAEDAAGFNIQTMRNEINRLTLDTDGQYIYLYRDGNLISEIQVSDPSSIIFCEGLVLNSESAVSLPVGQTAQIRVTVTPSDTNQRIRYVSADPSKVICSSTGLITAVGVGNTTVTVKCGAYQAVVTVMAARSVVLDHIAAMATPTVNDTNRTFSYYAGTEHRYLLQMPYNDERTSIHLSAGQKLVYTPASGYSLRSNGWYVLKPASTGGYTYSENWDGNEQINNVITTNIQFTGSGTKVQVVAQEECDLVVFLNIDAYTSAGEFIPDEVLEEINADSTCLGSFLIMEAAPGDETGWVA